jgi:hypothetical protein
MLVSGMVVPCVVVSSMLLSSMIVLGRRRLG